MCDMPTGHDPVTLDLDSAEATTALAEWLAPQLVPGDVILLGGSIGAGKSHFCRSLIHARLAAEGRHEDVPSPTFTLVQTYEIEDAEIWHADLYRAMSIDQIAELGLEEAFANAICLVEWPDRLGCLAPADALMIQLETPGAEDARRATLSSPSPRWAPILAMLPGAAETWDA